MSNNNKDSKDNDRPSKRFRRETIQSHDPARDYLDSIQPQLSPYELQLANRVKELEDRIEKLNSRVHHEITNLPQEVAAAFPYITYSQIQQTFDDFCLRIRQDITDIHQAQVDRSRINWPQGNRSQVIGAQINQDQAGRSQANEAQVSRDHANRSQVNGVQVKREQSDRSQINGPQVNQDQGNRSQVNQDQANRSQVNGTQIKQEQSDRSQVNEAQVSQDQANRSQVDRTTASETSVKVVLIHESGKRELVDMFLWGEDYHLYPESFRFPTGKIKLLWDRWWGGEPERDIRPYRQLKGHDLQKKDRVKWSKCSFVMRHLINIGISMNEISSEEDIIEQNLRQRDDLFNKIFKTFYMDLVTLSHDVELDELRVAGMSYTTLYDYMKGRRRKVKAAEDETESSKSAT